MSAHRPGDKVAVLHDCYGTPPEGLPVRHDVPVLIKGVVKVTGGVRYRGIRCDGTGIEWVEAR